LNLEKVESNIIYSFHINHLLYCTNIVNDIKGFQHRKFHLMEKCSPCSQRNPIAIGTMSVIYLFAIAIISIATLWTTKSTSPF